MYDEGLAKKSTSNRRKEHVDSILSVSYNTVSDNTGVT